MYIFGVYECVFSVVAVGWQPILCKGLKQTIIQSSWIRQTEEATRIDETTNHTHTFLWSNNLFFWLFFNLFSSVDSSVILSTQTKLRLCLLFHLKIIFWNATRTLGPSLAVRRVSLRATVWRMAAVLLWLVFLWRVRVDSLQSRAHCLVWWVALL